MICIAIGMSKFYGNLPVNSPKLLGPFQNSFTFFDVYMFRMSFSITSGTKKSDVNFFYCVLEQFTAIKTM